MKSKSVRLVFLWGLAFFAVASLASTSFADEQTPAVAPPIAGQYDSIMLAVTYMPDFCAKMGNKKECKSGAPLPLFGLHGLWPNRANDPKHTYRFCTSVLESQLKTNWCATATDLVKNGYLSQSTFANLSAVMPGAASCLYNHEWYAHGTCTSMTPENYYLASIDLMTQFHARSTFQDLVAKAQGSRVTRDQLIAALRADFGNQVESALVMACRIDGATQKAYLREIRFNLDSQNFASFPADKSFKPADETGDCPDGDIEILARTRNRVRLH